MISLEPPKKYRFSVLALLIRLQNFRLPRKRTVMIPLVGIYVTLMVTAQSAWAKDYTPVGIGDLLPSVDIPYTKGQGTLYEEYGNPLLYTVTDDYGMWDVMDPMLEIPAIICMALTAVVGSAAVTIVQWIFNVTTIPPLENAITASVGGAAKTLTETLLPSAMVIGALVAWANHRRAAGSGLSQLGWVAVSTIFSISLLMAPQTWVNGIDSVRNVGSSVAMNATSAGLGDGTKEPIDLGHKTTYGNNERDNMLRKSSDAVWRTYVATPWCVVQFGSLDACKAEGKGLLDAGVNPEDRKEHMKDVGDRIGGDSNSWVDGHNPVGRMMVAIPALICVILFSALVLMLAFASLASLIGALMMLVTGVIFACLWIIPGRPRMWGVRWFDFLLGYTLQSGIATMTLGSVLVVTTAATRMMGEYGYAAGAGISIATAIVAFKFRSVLESIVGVTGLTSPAAAVGGLLAARAAGKAGWGITKGLGRGLAGMRLPRMPRMPSRGGGGGGGNTGRPTTPQLPPGGTPGALAGARRPMPPLPSGQTAGAALPNSDSRREVGPLTSRPELPSSTAPARGRSVADGPAKAVPGTRRPAEVGGTRRPAEVGGSVPRQALPAASGSAQAATQHAPNSASRPAAGAASRPSPTLRTENSGASYTFRQGPKTGTSAPKVIPHKVVRSTPNRPGGSTGPNPTRPENRSRARSRGRGRGLSVPTVTRRNGGN
ncbi:hypothetical protein OG897_39780 [Streptomyces sp. NBC_00237]|uniref:hypothetical protein n=1 Tax=Streptomyces sp. NBC_00237 TaxID=2975687 RepID=UPI00225A809B|nr:hypothetical protein [Streptomyces sp. NBC_00237]MCX5207532.1 hypothetical protein [Streptomyces sp. NBC_00237]